MNIVEQAPLVDEILAAHREEIGKDFTAYSNHCHRVLNFCLALCAEGEDRMTKVSIAVAFHDLGIWTDRTFDYLGPSKRLARDWLTGAGRGDWSEQIESMIDQHHKIRRYNKDPVALVEPFREADWIDVSLGLLKFGLPSGFIAGVRSRFPNAGFHRRLIALSFERMRSHPASPLPMMKY